MAKAKKILIRERSETWRVRINKPHRRGMCPECQDEVDWMTGSEATEVSPLTEREVFRLAEDGGIHFAESDSGLLLICRRSLEDAFDMHEESR